MHYILYSVSLYLSELLSRFPRWSKKPETRGTKIVGSRAALNSYADLKQHLTIQPLKISAYQAAMLSYGRNVDQYEVELLTPWVADSSFIFRDTIFRDFYGNLYKFEECRDEDGKRLREFDPFIEVTPVLKEVTPTHTVYTEIEEYNS